MSWQGGGYDSWNCYSGDLDVLKATGDYNQLPGSNPLAGLECGLSEPEVAVTMVPEPGKVAFFLATGITGQGESGAGSDSSGQPRPMANGCP